MKPGISFNFETIKSDASSWIPSFPNPADFRFDYYRLLNNSPKGLASPNLGFNNKVAVIGAGSAGMTTARELFRCGFDVTIYEASGRIGGRLYTIPNPNGDTQAGMEMGAMRMPFFAKPGSENSILGYYLNKEAGVKNNNAILTPFPNPGSADGGTGIYINRGYGPNNQYQTPTLIDWNKGDMPNNETLQELTKKVSDFGKNFSIPANNFYTQDNTLWSVCWGKMVGFYEKMTFNDLVLEPAMSQQNILNAIGNLDTFDGNVGGFGMTKEQTELLYTIGTGDGSWGAFYSISALWFLRCTFFGFDSNLQTVEALKNAQSLPHYNSAVKDYNNVALKPPTYEGIQALVEYLFYVPPFGMDESLYENSKLFVNTPVTSIDKVNGGLLVVTEDNPDGELYNFVTVSSTQWAAQLSMEFNGFTQEELPQAKLTTENTQHNISSCKLFFPLKQKYWELPGNKIPQIMVTDTYIQDMYALNWNSKSEDNGVLLASYTWEDDSLKLLPFNEQELSDLVLTKLKEITTSTTGQDITQYVDTNNPVTIQWIKEPSYIGCAKLYRSHNESGNMLDLSYNQNYAKASGLYFAGENYSVEGGWTEPALRSALDCVIQLLNNAGATFNFQYFNYDSDYPKWPNL
ncbi:FAD-dependent oxidoreductase [Winogradskyella sp.]|uniref:flavin monoamine oxidase family protein n=1 Tax=Winogradskyella sp. TaxID=1883156 RepID=UPI0025CE2E12|nr:FAD-dependent oxidoreductase [Winogradskyella sp.]